MTVTLPDGRHATGPNEETLRCFVPEDFFKLGLTPAQTLTLIKLATLPHGLLPNRKSWLADQLETSKSRLVKSLRALLARGLIYDHQGSIYIDGERIRHLSETKRAEPDAEAMHKLDGTEAKKNCCCNRRSGSNSNLNNNNCGDYDKEHTNLSTTCGKIVGQGGQSVGNCRFTPLEFDKGGVRLTPLGVSVGHPIDLYREIKRLSIRRGVRGVWQIVGGKLIFVVRAVRRKDRINPDTSILCWFTFKGDMSFQQFRELVLQLTGVIVTPYEGLLPESMAGYAISMSMADKSELSKDALRKQLMQAKKRTSQKASKGGAASSAHAFNESEVYRALLSAGFTTAEIENKKRRGGMLIPAVMKFYGRQGWRLGRTAITFEVLTLKLKNVWLPREREKNPLRRYAPAA